MELSDPIDLFFPLIKKESSDHGNLAEQTLV